MVVQIHTASAFGNVIKPLCRIAVPVFFIISGYFMVDNNGAVTESRLRAIFAKMLRITIFTMLVYISYNMLLSLMAHGCLDTDYYARLKFWLKELLFGGMVCFHLWYLTAYLQLLVIFYVALRIRRFPMLFILIPIGVLLNLFLGRYFYDLSKPKLIK